jgi:pyridoxamine 5'-phosphate oxidase
MDQHPIDVLREWQQRAIRAGIALADAVCLATSTPDGAPSARMVLMRGIEDGRLVFFTDYRSRKACELEGNPRAAMVIHWAPLGRQVRVEGTVRRLASAASDRYFLSRPRGSRISAWASEQSAPVEDRETLERQRATVERRFEGRDVHRPGHWGGYALEPTRVEFWSERDDRFHDRLVFERFDGGWKRSRLQP